MMAPMATAGSTHINHFGGDVVHHVAVFHRFDQQMRAALHAKCATDERFATESPFLHLQKLKRYGDTGLFALNPQGFFPEASTFGPPERKGRLYLQLDDEAGFYVYNFDPGAPNVFMYKLKPRTAHRITYALVNQQGVVAYGIRCI